MNTLQLRDKIISHLRDYFESQPNVFAYWLGGSDANDESDEYSDLDLFFCVSDGQEEVFLREVRQALLSFGEFDYEEDIEHRQIKNSRTFHIFGTPKSLLIEVYALPRSEGMQFVEWHPAFKPKILFDKDHAISFRPLDREELKKNICEQIAEQKNLMMESDRAVKYVQRNEYIEATNYYIKYVFLPLVSVLRIKHTPLLHDWLRIHISRHFPKDVIERLEELMRFTSPDDILKNIPIARDWFWEIASELEKNFRK